MSRYKKTRLNGKKHVIFFHGEPNSGKTTTLHALGRMLLETSERYCEERIKNNRIGTKANANDWRIYSSWPHINFFICTMGDKIEHVAKAINDFATSADDIAIVASRWDSTLFATKCKNIGAAINTLILHDVPCIKEIVPKNRKSYCFTTVRELYLHLIHLITTGII